jgi:hypothetical protein
MIGLQARGAEQRKENVPPILLARDDEVIE